MRRDDGEYDVLLFVKSTIATRFRIATITRKTPPFHKIPNATPIGLFPTSTLVRKKGGPEANRRTTQAAAALTAITPKILMRRELEAPNKVNFVFAYVVYRLLYNVHTWERGGVDKPETTHGFGISFYASPAQGNRDHFLQG